MALQIHADGAVAYDSRLEDYTLLGLKTTTGLNKGGTAEIVMPPGHPAYNSFVSYKTVVTLRENGALRFRGRALYPTDDFYNIRTITCEGERCFLRDAVIRPYTYTADPASIFSAAVALYNAEVDEFKQFTLGVCTVTDANDYIRMESESAETFADFFDKLVDRCGGYIVFTDAADGKRAINWLAEIDAESGQTIEFGENLLEFARSGQSAELATAVLPYGAQLEDGTRVTIESVNGGLDYIEDAEAVALRGRIMATVVWDDVTEPANLLKKAQEWLAEHKLVIVSLELTAADLSRMDKNIDSYEVGDRVHVLSKPHGVDGYFQLTERTIDWLQHDGGSITLGRTVTSLTGADVIATQSANRAVNGIKTEVAKVVGGNASNADEVKAVETRLTSKIEQLADSIQLEVSGGLGNTAAIRLTVDGTTYTESLLLDNVRQAFADDSSAVTISAGTITFNSGTLVVNSDNFKVDSTGKITATGAQINGIMVTESGSYKAQLDGGGLDLYWQGNLCGTINTKYWSGASTEGICLRIEEDGHYIMFCSPNSDHATGYEVDYYLNYGWSSNYDEKHIFQTSARFLDDVYFAGYTRIRSLRLFGANGEYLVGISASGGLEISKL